jgi:hypothetical protein
LDPRLLTVLFIVFTALCLNVVGRGFLRWRAEGKALAKLDGTAAREQVRRHRRLGRRLLSLGVALLAMVALAFLAPLGAPDGVILVLQIIAILGVVLGIYWMVRA